MRIDKYLKISRLVKRRSLAKTLCDAKRVMINERVVKAGANVQVGDEITIRYGNKLVVARVEQIKEHVRKEEAATLYEIIKNEKLAQVDAELVDDDE